MPQTISSKQKVIDSYFNSDEDFNELYPDSIRRLAARHWTSVETIRMAIPFLTSDGGRILDIGSGVGKFCLTGAYYAPNSQFFGIEQREHLIQCAQRAQATLRLENAAFIHGNFTQLDLRKFDHFYFFNSFYENINEIGRIDDEVEYSDALFEYYTDYLFAALKKMSVGTKVVAFHSFHGEIPACYELVESRLNGDLSFWIKK